MLLKKKNSISTLQHLTLKTFLAGLILILLTVLFTSKSHYAVLSQSMEDVENPQSGSIGLSGIVPGQPPTQAAAINSPVNGQIIGSLPVTVSGTCEAGLIVEIYKNNTFAGSGMCADNNTFSIDIDLFNGENVLVAKVRDLLGQQGPDSSSITVIYNPPITESDRQIGQRLLLLTNVSFRGAQPGNEVRFPVSISGGTGPYAIATSWGDGNTDVLSRLDTGEFMVSHTFNRPGVYRVVVQATDETGQAAFLQLVAIIDGEAGGSLVADDDRPGLTIVRYVLWPVYVALLLIPISYWLGIRHQKRKYR